MAQQTLFGHEARWGGWHSADDALMGGRSKSRFVPGDDNIAIFLGTVSLEQNGGFASVRSPQFNIELPQPVGLQLHARGDGHIYHLCLHCAGLQPGTSYRCRFQPRAFEWQTIELAFSDFVLMRFGQRVGVSPVKPERISGTSLMISDRQEGAFALELASLAVYAAG